MNYLIVSDIHGDASSVKFIYELHKKNKFDKIICLGDVLYHGPRNDLPLNYRPKECISLLNEIKDDIICIKGNCDAEVDEMVLKFEIIPSLDITINNKKCHLEHGHHLDLYKGNCDIIMSGHTHIPVLELKNNILYLNPGSISIPKENSKRDYAIFNDEGINIYSIDNILQFSYKF